MCNFTKATKSFNNIITTCNVSCLAGNQTEKANGKEQKNENTSHAVDGITKLNSTFSSSKNQN